MAKSTQAQVAPTTSHVVNVSLSEVWADWKRNPRGAGVKPSKADARSFEALRNNIRALGGLLQPPVVVEESGPSGERFRIIAGYRRFEALSDLGEKDPALFARFDVAVRSTDVDYGSFEAAEGETEGAEVAVYNRHLRSGPLGEMLLAASENAMRQDVTVWDRIALAGKMSAEGLPNGDIVSVLGEQGYALGVVTIANYVKIASLPAKVAKRLRPLGGTGFGHAMKLIQRDYRVGGLASAPWDAPKQLAKIDELTAAIEEKKSKPKGAKPARFSVKPADLLARMADIEAVASIDVLVTLQYLLGLATFADVEAAIDSDFASALSGEGPEPETASELAPTRHTRKPRKRSSLRGFFSFLLAT